MKSSPVIVVDANLAIHTVVATSFSEVVNRIWSRLEELQARVFAPMLWRYEVSSVLHRYQYDGVLTSEEALAALETALALSVEHIEEDAQLCAAAFDWATRLARKAAYDGFYLAVAERLGGELWTADRRLVNAVRQQDVSWVRHVDEIAEG